MAERRFELTAEDVDARVRILALYGEVDRFQTGALSAAVEEARDTGREVIVDLSAASYLDSSVIAALVGASETGRRRGESFVVLCATPRIRRSLELKGLEGILRLARSRGQALELMAGESGRSDARSPTGPG